MSIPYSLFCRGGMGPGVMKIIMYEGNIKYGLIVETAICRDAIVMYGGEFKADGVTQKNKIFHSFIKQQWEDHKCE